MGRASPVTRIPSRHWRTYGNNYLTGTEALDEPFAAFPSWFMRVTCERCGHERMFNESHSAQRWMLISTILDRMRHDGARRSKAAEGSAQPS
jgi:predicted nucleic-acid-binding Zn-ribbon protein